MESLLNKPIIILDVHEYHQLKNNQIDPDALQKLCTMVANHYPIIVPWDVTKTPRPWGCKITGTNIHCDYCPVREQCKYLKKSVSK